MKGLKEIRVLNYWAHMYESVVFGVDGKVVESKSIDRNGNVSGATLTNKSIENHINQIFDGDYLTKNNYKKLEQRYTPPRYPNKKLANEGYYLGTLYLSFHSSKGTDSPLAISINFSPKTNYDSNIVFYLSTGNYQFSLKDYTKDDHSYMLGLLLGELS
ncbi:MAG: hypothetical protein ABS904_00235 [Solibacillus isronensis]